MPEDQTEDQEGGSLEGRALVETAWNAFQAARLGVNQPVPSWEELDDEYVIPFSTAVLSVRDYVLASESAEGRTFSAAAAIGLSAFLSASGTEGVEYSPVQTIPFEAVARHVVNALAWDEEDHGELSEHESAWTEWAKHQLDKMRETV